jgi:signal transduction histidine kinase
VLREKKLDSEVQHPIMTEILERVDRLNTAVQDLLEYAKPMSPHETRLQLSDVLDSTLSTLLRDPRLQGIEILKDYRQAIDVETDVSIIERVFINIILNAAQAMKSTGKLQITLESRGDEALVSFRDTGPGIESEVLGKIFNPFFTTRSEGSGLGLALCKKYTEVLGGRIEVTTELGVGTTFVISLPKTGDP